MRPTDLTRRAALIGAGCAFSPLAALAQPAATAAAEASRSEGELFVFTNLAAPQWTQSLKAFGALYPWVKVRIVDLGSEVFERYYAESASGGRGADLIVSGGGDNWLELVGKGMLMPYRSSEDAGLPGWSKPVPGLYTLAADPAVIIYNKRLIPEAEAPKSVHEIAALLAKRPDLANRLSTYAVAGQFGRGANWAWISRNPDAWDVLAKLGPATRPERTVGPMIEKVTTGEYALAWLVSGAALFEKLKSPAYRSILGWNYIADGTPVIPRRMGIVTTAKAPNAAKLLLDFLLSKDGQTAVGKDGATPYRPDIDKAAVQGLTYDAMVAGAGGETVLVREELSPDYVKARQGFLDRWKTVFLQAK